jgi:hypothetical protein
MAPIIVILIFFLKNANIVAKKWRESPKIITLDPVHGPLGWFKRSNFFTGAVSDVNFCKKKKKEFP